MSDLPTITLTGVMPIQLTSAIDLRIQRGERLIVVRNLPQEMFDATAERQSDVNHGQTLARIKQRCGFCATEALAVLSGLKYEAVQGLAELDAHRVLYAMRAVFNRGQRVAEARAANASHPHNPAEDQL